MPFIAAGGAYLVEILPTGKVRLAACIPVEGGGQDDVEEEISENGPELMAAVDRLVRASIKHVSLKGVDSSPTVN